MSAGAVGSEAVTVPLRYDFTPDEVALDLSDATPAARAVEALNGKGGNALLAAALPPGNPTGATEYRAESGQTLLQIALATDTPLSGITDMDIPGLVELNAENDALRRAIEEARAANPNVSDDLDLPLPAGTPVIVASAPGDSDRVPTTAQRPPEGSAPVEPQPGTDAGSPVDAFSEEFSEEALQDIASSRDLPLELVKTVATNYPHLSRDRDVLNTLPESALRIMAGWPAEGEPGSAAPPSTGPTAAPDPGNQSAAPPPLPRTIIDQLPNLEDRQIGEMTLSDGEKVIATVPRPGESLLDLVNDDPELLALLMKWNPQLQGLPEEKLGQALDQSVAVIVAAPRELTLSDLGIEGTDQNPPPVGSSYEGDDITVAPGGGEPSNAAISSDELGLRFSLPASDAPSFGHSN